MKLSKKKTYNKPELFYESFTLSQDIASNCEGIALFGENVCGVKVNMMDIDMVIYGYGSGACEYQPPNPESFVCYHAPSDANNVFSS